jgi:predicted transcriptional regulator
MDQLPTALTIETAARDAGLSIKRLCHEAGIASTTFYDWKKGISDPKIGTVNKWLAVIDDAKHRTVRPAA